MAGSGSSASTASTKRLAALRREALEVRAEHHGGEVLARVLGLDAHVLEPRLGVGEAGPLQPRRGLLGRRRSSTGPAQPGERRLARPRRPPPGPTRRCPRRRTGRRAGRPAAAPRTGARTAGRGRRSSGTSRSRGSRRRARRARARAGRRRAPRRAGPSRSRASSTIAGEPSTATTSPRGSRSTSAAVTPPGAAAGVEHALVAAQLEPVEHLAAHRLQRRRDALVGLGVPVARTVAAHAPSHHAARPRRRASADQRATSSFGWRHAAEHVAGDDVGVGRVRAPDADAHAVEVRAAELALERLQPVVAGQAAAHLDADVAERQVDLVVDDEDAVEVELVATRARGRPSGPESFMNVCGLSTATRGPPGPVRPSVSSPANFFFGFGQVPALDQRVGDAEADVVRGVRVAGPGIAEPDDQPVDRGGARRASAVVARGRLGRRRRRLGLAASPSSPSAGSIGSPSSPTSSVSVSISSSTGSCVGGVIVAMTVSSRSSSSVTPCGHGDGGQRERVVHLQVGDVVADRVRDVVRERLDVELARLLAQHAALGRRPAPPRRRRARARRWTGSAGSCRRAAGRRGSPRRAPDGSGRP